MTNQLKIAINNLQHYIDNDSDNILLIFDDIWWLDRYKQTCIENITIGRVPKDYFDKTICITIEDLINRSTLDGRRFSEYHFVI